MKLSHTLRDIEGCLAIPHSGPIMNCKYNHDLREMHTYSKIKSDCYYTTVIKHCSYAIKHFRYNIKFNKSATPNFVKKKKKKTTNQLPLTKYQP